MDKLAERKRDKRNSEIFLSFETTSEVFPLMGQEIDTSQCCRTMDHLVATNKLFFESGFLLQQEKTLKLNNLSQM